MGFVEMENQIPVSAALSPGSIVILQALTPFPRCTNMLTGMNLLISTLLVVFMTRSDV